MSDRAELRGDNGLSLEEVKEAMQGQRALAVHFAEIRERMFDLIELHGDAKCQGEAIQADTRSFDPVVADIAALVGYAELLMRDNERLVAFLIGLEEAGTISRVELEFLMGLRIE